MKEIVDVQSVQSVGRKKPCRKERKKKRREVRKREREWGGEGRDGKEGEWENSGGKNSVTQINVRYWKDWQETEGI